MDFLDKYQPETLKTSLLWEALVEIDEREDLGIGPLGPRGIVPITGGYFRAGPGMGTEGADFHGSVLAGGADRQQLRPDGAKELDALYEMRVADGAVLTIRNHVVIDETGPGPRYAVSRIQVTAPEGRWAWLNRRLIVGTLQSAKPERQAVIIRGWLVAEV